jgi:hypothetical protein
LLITVPDKRFTFDRDRRRTKLRHLIEDHQSALNPQVLNLVHLKEWATYVAKLAEGSPDWQTWINQQIEKGYTVHNHVWIMSDIISLMIHLWRNENTIFSLFK